MADKVSRCGWRVVPVLCLLIASLSLCEAASYTVSSSGDLTTAWNNALTNNDATPTFYFNSIILGTPFIVNLTGQTNQIVTFRGNQGSVISNLGFNLTSINTVNMYGLSLINYSFGTKSVFRYSVSARTGVYGCQFTNITAGAVLDYDQSATIVVNNSTFRQIQLQIDHPVIDALGDVTVSQSSFFSNVGNGLVYVFGSLNMSQCTISDNAVDSINAGIFSSIFLTNTLFTNSIIGDNLLMGLHANSLMMSGNNFTNNRVKNNLVNIPQLGSFTASTNYLDRNILGGALVLVDQTMDVTWTDTIIIGGSNGGFFLANKVQSTNLTVRNVTFENAIGPVIYTPSVSSVVLQHSSFRNITAVIAFSFSGPALMSIYNTTFRDISCTGTSIIYFNGSQLSVDRSTFQGMSSSYVDGESGCIDIDRSMVRLNVSNTQFVQLNQMYSVLMDPSIQTADFTNITFSSVYGGVFVYREGFFGGALALNVYNCTFFNVSNPISLGLLNAISSVTIRHVSFFNCLYGGLNLASVTDYTTITDVTFYNSTLATMISVRIAKQLIISDVDARDNTNIGTYILCTFYSGATGSLTHIFSKNNTGDHFIRVSTDLGSFSSIPHSLLLRNISIDGFTGIYPTSSAVSLSTTGIDQLVIEDSSFTNLEFGGGLVISSIMRNLTITNTLWRRCSSVQGAAISLTNTIDQMYLSNSTFLENSADQSGGAIYIGGYMSTISISDVLFEGNSVLDTGGAFYYGGFGLGIVTQMHFQGVRFLGNSAESSGGAAFFGGAADNYTFNDFEVSHHQGGQQGAFVFGGLSRKVILSNGKFFNNSGGALMLSPACSVEHFNITDCDFSGNDAFYGGGIYIQGAVSIAMTLESTTMEGNNATGNGGSIMIKSSRVQQFSVKNSTISGSADLSGGAIYIDSAKRLGQLNLIDSSILGSAQLNGGGIYLTGYLSQICWEGTTVTDSSASQGGGLYIDPRFSFDQWNSSNVVYSYNAAVKSGGAIYNGRAGAFLLNGTSFISNTGGTLGAAYFSPNPSNLTVASSSFVNNSAASGGAIYLTNSNRLSVQNSIFQGNKAAVGDGGSLYVGNNNLAQLFQVNISDGSSNNNGGALIVQGGTLVIDECSVYDNTATNGGGLYVGLSTVISMYNTTWRGNRASSQGGGVYSYRSIIDLQRNDFMSNVASDGAGMSAIECRVEVDDSVFIENSATSLGGGIYALSTTSQKRDDFFAMNVTRTTLNKNRADTGGAVMMVNNQTVWYSISSCIVRENNATRGAAFGLAGNVQIYNTIVSDGTSDNGQLLYASADSNVRGEGNSLNGQALSTATSVSLTTTGDFSSSTLVCPNGVVQATNVTKSCLVKTDKGIHLSNTSIVAIAIGAGGGLLLLIVLIMAIIIFKRNSMRRRGMNGIRLERLNVGEEMKKTTIPYSDLRNFVKIGAGAFGIVYSADWRNLTVAVKQLQNQESITQKQFDEFIQEVDIIRKLRSHPNVVLFIGITIRPDPISLITEFCGGGDLFNYLRKNEVDMTTKRKFILQIALGLQHLHSEKVIHRDLAARNILLTSDLVCKVSDFGLSREQKQGVEESKTESNVGPLKWMAPEAIHNQLYSIQSDVYSYGIVVWEILNTSEPYPGISPVEAAVTVLNGLRPPIDHLDVGLKDLNDIMSACWQLEANKRPHMSTICCLLKGEAAPEAFELPKDESPRPDGTQYRHIQLDNQYGALM
ncbi:hypothetical protein PROFUN_12100 [Planoprotostelium fungivorum]|uniref:Protein kinase domain-containing protein n=1 Tax=Planoprotostelium fungivorum TaxID=1890364 RepID=A0A2P6N8D3_9EUKA|nr:hypothetical protein PROFUN_12100 [Planoprotostelium fungivorum]